MPHRLKVADVMTREVVTLDEEDSLADARRLMQQGRIRHLPVLQGERLVGLLSHRDLLAASFSVFADETAQDERRMFSQIPVRELMHEAVAVSPDLPIREAAEILLARKFGCLPVIDAAGALLGIVTEADFVRLFLRVLHAIQA
jgi:CBS domain-containing membrane protein